MKFIILFFLVSSCTHLGTQRLLGDFTKSMELSLAGDVKASRALWKELCQKKHKASCLLSGEKVNWHPQLAVMQASSDESSVTLVYLKKENESHRSFVYDPVDKKIIEMRGQMMAGRKSSSWAIVEQNFYGLKKDREYLYVILGELGQLLDFRRFKTLSNHPKSKWAVASCMADHYDEIQKNQWSDLLSFNPDMIFMIGDNVYVDWGKKKSVDPDFIWKRHVQTRNSLEVFRREKLTPVFATWDDHDYGLNDSGEEFPYKSQSAKIFKKFFPVHKNKVVKSLGPGVSSSLEISGQQFLFMDNRSFRTRKESKKKEAHFGLEQKKWAFKEMKSSQHPTWIISGDQFFGAYHPFESFEGNHPKAFTQFLSELGKLNKKVLFVSGDRHLSEIMEVPKKSLGYKTYEITSSAIHSTVYKGSFDKAPNPISMVHVDGRMNYMIIESEVKKGRLEFNVKDYGENKELIFERNLKL